MNNKQRLSAVLLFTLFSIKSLAEPTEKSAKTSVKTNKPQLQLATKYQENHAISDYFVSEKLDGIRGYWNGNELLTRQGNKLFPPDWFIKHWPKKTMDGELWIARDSFEKTSSCVLKKSASNCWQQVKFMMFDLPKHQGTFGERVAAMKALTSTNSSAYLHKVKQARFATEKALYQYLDEVVEAKGEGLMLHYQNALYQQGRTNDLMKLKKYQDAEAKVIMHNEGKGKYQGMLGAILVEMPNGLQFKIGSGFSDLQRKNPPKIGSIITYKYFGKTQRGIPKFASFMRVRDNK